MTPQTYAQRVLLHPFHVATVVAVAVLATLTKSLWLIPLVMVAEVFLGGAVVCARRGRGLLKMESEVLLPPEYRSKVFAQIDDDHRRELERLEVMVANISDNCRTNGSMLLEQPWDLTLLLRAYGDLAIAFQELETSVESIDRVSLIDELSSLNSDDVRLTSERVKRLVARRRDIIHRRLAYWDQSRQSMKEIEHQLATIINIIGLLHEKSMIQSQVGWTSDEIDRIAEDIERHEVALLELKL
jgi:hypothetical protein